MMASQAVGGKGRVPLLVTPQELHAMPKVRVVSRVPILSESG